MRRTVFLLAILTIGFSAGSCKPKESVPFENMGGYSEDLNPGDLLYVDVVRVLSGDTIAVRIDGVEERCRLAHIEAPAKGAKGFHKARGVLADILRGRRVVIESHRHPDSFPFRGPDGKLVVLVNIPIEEYDRKYWIANIAMVTKGWAKCSSTHGKTPYFKILMDAQAEAREAKRGIWADKLEE